VRLPMVAVDSRIYTLTPEVIEVVAPRQPLRSPLLRA
jgi:hypothetical protein